MCDELFGCDHEPEVPVEEDGEIVYWLCRCGRKHYPEPEGPELWQRPTQELAAERTFRQRPLLREVQRVLDSLTPKEREVLEKRFPKRK